MRRPHISTVLLPLLGAGGAVFAMIYTTVLAEPAYGVPQPLTTPLSSPFHQSIAGTGITEANTRNLALGAHVAGVVSLLHVKEGDVVQKGQPLFTIDDRQVRADITTQKAAVETAMAEEVNARAALAETQDQLRRAQDLRKGLSVSAERVEQLQLSVKTAQTRVNVARTHIDTARATLDAANVTLARMTVVAPVDGTVLQVNVRPGEYVAPGAAVPPMIIGNVTPLHVRVSVDENDLWRFKANTAAVGALRGNSAIKFPMTFVRVDPFVVPKKSLTGQSNERVDTRVLDIIYRVDDATVPLFVGQQIEVYLEASDHKDDGPAAEPAS